MCRCALISSWYYTELIFCLLLELLLYFRSGLCHSVSLNRQAREDIACDYKFALYLIFFWKKISCHIIVLHSIFIASFRISELLSISVNHLWNQIDNTRCIILVIWKYWQYWTGMIQYYHKLVTSRSYALYVMQAGIGQWIKPCL